MKTAKVNDAIVIEHETLPTRWYDIFGECQKFDLAVGFPNAAGGRGTAVYMRRHLLWREKQDLQKNSILQ